MNSAIIYYKWNYYWWDLDEWVIRKHKFEKDFEQFIIEKLECGILWDFQQWENFIKIMKV